MRKKIIFGIVSISLFRVCYYFTKSMKYSLIGLLVVLIYGFWLIRFELGLSMDKEERDRKTKKLNSDFKKRLDKCRKENPTI